VIFCGYRADVREAIARADVALSSAREEGLGIALLEAMAMARPVVAVPVGGIPEIVDDPRTGWLARERSARALADAMKAAVDAPEERAARGREARARVVDHFSIEAMRHGYERVYARLGPRLRLGA
jgi:glycosyltransferase involved in cell wall biosynthesis